MTVEIKGKQVKLVPLTKEEAKEHIGEMVYAWDDSQEEAYLLKLIFTKSDAYIGERAFIVVDDREYCDSFAHIALIPEVEETETRLTNYEIAQLLKCFGVEGKFKSDIEWHGEFGYNDKTENIKVCEDIIIRYRCGEWEEPTRETVLTWYNEDDDSSDISKFVDFIGWDKE